MPLTDNRTTRLTTVDLVTDHRNQLQIFEPSLRPADPGCIHRRQNAKVMRRTGLMRRKRHHDAPFRYLQACILHYTLKDAARDHGQLEGQVFAKIECKGLGLVFHAAILSVVPVALQFTCGRGR
jgi:hypothetical protein